MNKDNINIFFLGGQDEHGKNLAVIEVNDNLFIINAGVKIPISNFYGIDSFIPDFHYLRKNKKRIKGVFISHAHDEVFAALPWLIMEIKGLVIYGSDFSIEVAKSRIAKYAIGHNDYEFKKINKAITFGETVVEAYEVANSIPGSLIYNFITKWGSIIYASSLTLGNLGPFGKTDLQEIKSKAPNVLALILDARKSHFKIPSFEKISVSNIIEQKFKKVSKNSRIIIGAYDEEMYTLFEIIEIAKKYNRPVSIYGSVFDFLYKKMLLENTEIQLPTLINYKRINHSNNVVVLVTGTQSRLYKRFLRIATNKDIYLKLKPTDSVIALAPPLNGLEVEASEALDEVAKISPDILDVTDKDFYPARVTYPDIRKIISILKPKYFFPSSALYRYLVVAREASNMNNEKVIILKNGKIAKFVKGSLVSRSSQIKESGDVIIDGFGVGDISMEVIRERTTLGTGGLIIAAGLLDIKKRKIINNLNLKFFGVATAKEIKEAQQLVKKRIEKKIMQVDKWEIQDLQNKIKRTLKRFVFKLFGKDPLIIISFFTT